LILALDWEQGKRRAQVVIPIALPKSMLLLEVYSNLLPSPLSPPLQALPDKLMAIGRE